MKSLLALAAALLATTALAAEPVREIVVTARPLSQTDADLRACIARGCPPDEDVRASLAHAENQFVSGAYRDARRTLERSLDRNRLHKPGYPVELSNLLRGLANVSEHLGEATVYRLSVLEMRDTLKRYVAADDPRTLGAELEVGDSRLKMGYPEEASRKYRDIEDQSLKAGLPHVAALARLRHLSLLAIEAQVNKFDRWRMDKARKEIRAFIADPTPGAEKYALIGHLLLARLDRAEGDHSSTDALIAEFIAQGGADRPTLIYSPPMDIGAAIEERGKAWTQLDVREHEKWVDMGFWVNDDGRVEDIEILRNVGPTAWTEIVVRSLENRLYMPAKDAKKMFMVERYTLTAHWVIESGSAIRKRSKPRIERLDLTP